MKQYYITNRLTHYHYTHVITCVVIYLLFYLQGLPFSAEAYSSHSGISLKYTIDKTTIETGQKPEISVKIINNTNYALRGFYYSEYFPSDFSVETISVSINSAKRFDFIFEQAADEIYEGKLSHRWILETPPEFPESNLFITGQGGVLDIKYTISCSTQGSYQFSINNWVGFLEEPGEPVFGYSDSNITLEYEDSGLWDMAFDLDLQSGWTMISLPVQPKDLLAGKLFPGASAIFRFDQRYQLVEQNETMEIGRGYWIYLSEARTYRIKGKPITNYTIQAQNGWSMIGPCSFPGQVYITDGSIQDILGFEGNYQTLGIQDHLKPGQGYWICIKFKEGEQTELSVK